jgi:oligopeptidase B
LTPGPLGDSVRRQSARRPRSNGRAAGFDVDLYSLERLMETLAPKPPSQGAAPLTPPKAQRHPKEEHLHGDERRDDYFWLRERPDPEVRAYLEAENAYAEGMTREGKGLQESLYAEMLKRIKETDLSVPYPERGFLYYSRSEEGKQYPIFCRKRRAPEGAEEITVDLNALAQGRPFIALGAYTVSDDGRFLAYTTDDTGFRQYRLFVKDLEDGSLLKDRVEKVTSVAWAGDGEHLFLTVEDDAKRSYRLLKMRLGGSEPSVLYEETDERFSVQVWRTRSRRFLVLSSASHTASEARVLEADRPDGPFRLIAPRRGDHEYDIDHHDERFFIRTNDRGRNFRIATVAVSRPDEAAWEELVPHRDDVIVEGIDLFESHAVLFERHDGLPRFRILDFRGGPLETMSFPEPVYSVWPSQNAEWETETFRYGYESFLTPSSVFEYDFREKRSRLLKKTEVLGGYDPAEYTSGRLHATALDGTKIPISYVFRKDKREASGQPLHLYGYGSYGISIPDGFSSNRVSLLDRGVVFAIAHIRGGGELGKAWHDQGRMMSKQNTFTDFIACAEHLIAEGFARRGALTIEGGSAGGLLMGAVVNMRPDLFRAVLTKVPFVDVINTMMDESLPLTVGEYEEWGNPHDRLEYEYMKTYCPYTNLSAKRYPAMLVKTSFFDSQVMYWEPAKYVARLRVLKTDDEALLLRTNMAAGHGGASGRYDFLHEVAFDYAFLLSQLGLKE